MKILGFITSVIIMAFIYGVILHLWGMAGALCFHITGIFLACLILTFFLKKESGIKGWISSIISAVKKDMLISVPIGCLLVILGAFGICVAWATVENEPSKA